MFTCIWQLWDWFESPPLFTANMESKKLQQFQYANSHLAPQKKLSLTYHQPPPNSMDEFHNMNYASTVFQNQHGQYHSILPNFEQNHSKSNNQQTPSSSSSQLTPMDSTPQSLGQHNMIVKSSALQNVYQQQQHQMVKQQQPHHNPYGAEMLYQTPREARAYHIKALNSKAILDNNTDSKSSPVTSLQEQYQQLQQAKMCIQIQTQNEALVQQQKTFAMRQALNPPIPQTHFQRQNQYSGMSGSPSVQSNVNQESVQHQLPIMQSTHRNIPPTSLNLCTQFQPAQGPIKIDYGQTGKIQTHYHQANTYPGRQIQLEHNSFPQKQYNNLTVQNKSESAIIGTASGDPSPVYIQQNHPGHVVNQACQTQISGGIGNKNVTPTSIKHKKTPTSSTEESSTSTTKSPSHAPAERKKSFGTIQALKSPITKRPESSTVTLSGWLYKQGSDGLKVWRKRWFVLSEYCLYYYKGPEEEKLLGSILLPSYIVSACLPEDKIYRKFAFKCEHTNMRTYWLAAENSEQMCQWVKALMAATLMQASSDSDQTSQPSFTSLNHTGENSDSGINTFQSNNKFTVQHPPLTPVGPDNIGNAMQPLYANAPPKPRRINDGGYSSPSPDIDRNDNSPNQQGRHIEHKSHHAIYDTRTGNVTSKLHVKNTSDNHMPPIQYQQHHPSDFLDNRETEKNSGYYIGNEPRTGNENDYRKSPSVQKLHHDQFNNPNANLELQEMVQLFSQNRLNDEIYGDKNLYVQRQQTRPYNYVNTGAVITYPNVERRTPDAYGRSKSRLQGRFFSDYEDIYNLTQQEQHLQGIHPELAYRRPLSPPTYNNQKNIPPMPSRYTPNNLEVSHASNVNLRNKLLQPTGITRPHSADFLEYEARIEGAIQNKSEIKRAPRPKSSLDINRAPDSYYYSEESYAEKMRQSALYLQKPQNQQHQQQQHPSPGTNLAPVVSSTLPTNYNNIRNQNISNHPYSSEMNIRFENTYGDNGRIKKQKNDNFGGNTLIKGSESVPRLKTNTASSVLAKDYHLRLQQNEQFLRSASARLPKNCDTDETIGNSTTSLKEGERKREESMKRLLEWKQRMLQSPLTRKGVQINGSPSILKLGSNPNVLLSSQGNIQRSPSEPHTNTGYNSYSSDDEDGRPELPAGRSTSPTTIINTTTPSIDSIDTINNKNLSNYNINNVNINTPKNLSPNIIKKSNNNNNNEQIPSHDLSSNSNSNISINSLNTSLLVSSTYVPVYKQKTLLQNQILIKKSNSNENEQQKLYDNKSFLDYTNITSDELKLKTNLNQSDDNILEFGLKNSSNNDKENENFQILNDENLQRIEGTETTNIEEIILDKSCEYTDDDLDEALADDNMNISNENFECLYENEQPDNQINTEGNYLPMTPRKSILSATNSLPVLNNLSDSDENPYVEMTKGVYEVPSKSGNYEIVCISSTHNGISHQHHHSEPVYMELAQGKSDKNNKDKKIIDCKKNGDSRKFTLKKNNTNKNDLNKKKSKKITDRQPSKRKDLPDILKASQNPGQISDSSDADDESSRDFIENTKIRSRSRFSLSDTFRPASYYIGASTPLNNCAESSDSEIVSPPPIPALPPPLELELNTEEIFSSENYDTVKRKDKLNLSCDQIPKIIHSSNSSLALNKTGGLKGSRLSLPDQFSKYGKFKTNILMKNNNPNNNEKTYSDSNYSFHTSSNTSSDFDLYNKIKDSSPSFTGDEQMYQSNSSLPQKLSNIVNLNNNEEIDSVELRQRFNSDSELEKQRSRRPLSETSVSEIEQINEQFEETLSTTDLDSYFSRLRTSDLYLNQNSDISLVSHQNNDTLTTIPFIKPPEIFRNENDKHFYRNINFVSSTDSLQCYENDNDLPADGTLKANKFTTNHNLLRESDLMMHNIAFGSGTTIQTPLHSRDNSLVLSDKCYSPNIYSHHHDTLLPVKQKHTLNNQRDININIRTTEISHIHNPISRKMTVNEAINIENKNRTQSIVDIDRNNQLLYKMPIPSLDKNISKDLCNKNLKSPLIGSIASGLDDILFNNNSLTSTPDSYSYENCRLAPLPLQSPSGLSLNIPSTSNISSNKIYNSTSLSQNLLSPSNISNFSPSSSANNSLLSEKQLNFNSSSNNNDTKLSDKSSIIDENVLLTPVSDVSSNNTSSKTELGEGGGEEFWEEDKLWQDSLRKVSQRHAKSLDDLDRISLQQQRFTSSTKPKITRCAIYVNDKITNRSSNYKHNDDINNYNDDDNNDRNENDVYVQLVDDTINDISTDDYEVLREDNTIKMTTNFRKSTEIDRETIRQWDSMSSGLMKNTSSASSKSDGQGGASISVRNVRNIPKYNFTAKPTASSSDLRINPNNQKYSNSYYAMNNYTNENYYPGEDELGIYHGMNNVYPIRKSGSRAEIDILERETSSQIRNLDMSAGDLLSRTHEELVLLLIQLRRQNSQTARTIEQCCTNIHEDQNRIRTTSGLTRAESIQRLDYLKQHLLDLEKQYEKSKPLVNLVDNMVKLGSLYRNNETNQRNESATLDRINFNQKIQERRLLEEEQIRWDRLSPNHNELQSKVNQLYELDQLLQEESGTLQILQKDKENLEVALSDLRARLQVSNDPPIILEAAKKQQLILEMELSRVHKLLAENSKKLEQTVAGNARLEQELLILRQKLQSTTTTGSRGSSHGGFNQNNSDSIQYESSTAILLESELKRVQKLVGDMQRQRQELSQTVQQLTANSNRLYQEIGNKDPTNANSNFTSHIKKRYNSSCWTETDLDSMATIDYTSSYSADGSNLSTPLYVDTNTSINHINSNNSRTKYDNDNAQIYGYTLQDTEIMENSGVESDDLLETNPFANLSNQERQEIKTVRIVKRESERRQKDRERSGLVPATVVSSQNLNQVMEEDNSIQNMTNRTKSLPRNYDILNNQTVGKSVNTHENINASIYKQSGMSNTNNLPNVGAISYSDYYSTSLSNTKNPYPHLISDKNSNFVPSSGTYKMHSKDLNPSNGTNRGEHAKIHSSSNGRQKTKTQSIQNPIFQSEAARQIISEMSGSASEDNAVTEKVPSAQKQRRAIPREKRKHFTTPSNVNHKAVQKVFMEQANQNNTNWRAKDDLDMEVALRPRINAPDVVRSALGQGEKISENTIDRLFGAPNKILIPERYIPEQAPELSPEEKKRRQEKVEAIKKMLSEAPINNDNNVTNPTTKITDEKKQREHLLQLNQILAQQVMQMSKIVAEKAMSTKRTELSNSLTSEEDHSSTSEDTLPIFQQRDNFFT